MSPEGLRKKAKAGFVPGAKPGKHWVFLTQDLVEHIRQGYDSRWQAPSQRSILWQQQQNQSTSLSGKAQKHGGIAELGPI